MHPSPIDSRQASGYRERVTPSLWTFIAALVCAPMATLTFLPSGAVLALVIGVAVAGAIIGILIAAAPVITVADGMLRAGRAHIDARFLGEPVQLSGKEARQARGPGLSRYAWHLIRGGVDGIVVVPIHDPRDPATEWVISSRTPDRLAAAIGRARRQSQAAHSVQMNP